MRSRKLRIALLSTLALGGVSAVLAFNLDGRRWPVAQTVFHVGLGGASPSGASWSDAFKEAMAEWNDNTDFTFIGDDSYVDPCTGHVHGSGDGRNSIDFRADVCGSNFDRGVLAVTLTLTSPGTLGFEYLTQTDIVFNSAINWDVYDGPIRNVIDFRRVAVHELGHALGLDHERRESAIMAPFIGSIDALQPDDIAGAKALYGLSQDCHMTSLPLGSAVNDALADGDCRILDLYRGGADASFVDVYRLNLPQSTFLDIRMSSDELDSVLVLTRPDLSFIESFDDEDGCNAVMRGTLQAGEYYLLANTYDVPRKCAGNTGNYSLTISASHMPVLGSIRNASGSSPLPEVLIKGGATADNGATFAGTFTSNQSIDVLAEITPDPNHVGQQAQLYVLAVLGDGRQFMKNASGQFVRFSGGLANVVPLRSGTLSSLEEIRIADDLPAAAFAGQRISVFVGYALASSPANLYFNGTPLSFQIE